MINENEGNGTTKFSLYYRRPTEERSRMGKQILNFFHIEIKLFSLVKRKEAQRIKLKQFNKAYFRYTILCEIANEIRTYKTNEYVKY